MYTYIYYKDRVELPNTVISAYLQGGSIVHIDKKRCCLVLVILMYIQIIKRKLCVRLHSFSLNTRAFTKKQLLWGANIAENNIEYALQNTSKCMFMFR